jgi:hypothetical protein
MSLKRTDHGQINNPDFKNNHCLSYQLRETNYLTSRTNIDDKSTVTLEHV